MLYLSFLFRENIRTSANHSQSDAYYNLLLLMKTVLTTNVDRTQDVRFKVSSTIVAQCVSTVCVNIAVSCRFLGRMRKRERSEGLQ